MLQHPHLVHPRQQQHYAAQSQYQTQATIQSVQLPLQPGQQPYQKQSQQLPQQPSQQQHLHPTQQIAHQQQKQHHQLQQKQSSSFSSSEMHSQKHKRPLTGQYLAKQTSLSSSDEDIRSTPEFEGKFLFSCFYSSFWL